MKRITIILSLIFIIMTACYSKPTKEITLNKPNTKRDCLSMMETLSNRASSREFSKKELNIEDLSDLLWAANGINRKDGKRTAPSAKNKQDIDVYAFFKDGVYKYNAAKHSLEIVSKGDHFKLISNNQSFVDGAPLALLYVSDYSKFAEFGEEPSKMISAMDAGIVCQNVNLFCASIDLACIPRINMDKEGISKLLKLSKTQIPVMNTPIGYKK